MADITRLTASRGGNRAAATRLVNKINDIVADGTTSRAQKIHELQNKIANLEAKMATIEEIDASIQEELDPDDVAAEMDAADIINQTLRDAKDGFTFQLRTLQDAEDAANAAHAVATAPTVPITIATPGPSASALPKLDLPIFKGDILHWSSFWDVFESEVDSKSYGGATKFNFLISKLEGEAKAALLGLTSSNDNYIKAKDILRERYSQPKKVVSAHYKALINLPVANATRSSLRAFADQLESHIRGLEALGTASTFYGDLLVCFLIDKLAIDVRRNLTRHQGTADWTLDELRTAINREIEIMGDTCDLHTTPRPVIKQVNFTSAQSHQTARKKTCAFCSGDHFPTKCTEFKTPEDRTRIVRIKKLCANCLHTGHTNLKDCPSRFRCLQCNQPHHTSIHSDKSSSGSHPKPSSFHTGCLQTKTLPKTVNPTSTDLLPFVFLKTAIASVSSHHASHAANLLIDDGSQLTFITAKLANILHLHPIRRALLCLSGFKGFSASSPQPTYYNVVNLWLNGLNGDRVQIQAVVLPTIVDPLEDPYRTVLSSLPHLKDIVLAHPPTSNVNFSVDILIGADSYWTIVGDENVHGQGPTAVNSLIGYLISGPLPGATTASQRSSYHISASHPDDVDRLWSLEAIGIFPDDENDTDASIYQANSISFQNGQYTANLPWKPTHPELPSNYLICQKRTRNTVQNLLKKSQILPLYSKIIRDQLTAGFIERVPRSLPTPGGCHYIPHFAVIKDSATTPIRIVYDCSCKTRSGISLNDCLLTGPPLQNDMLHILLRFRIHHIGISSDIEKAFHRVLLHESDRDFVRFLWLSNDSDPDSDFDIYRFRVIPFGASCSPFILNCVIKKHLQRHPSTISSDIESNIYVDNLITGCDSTTEAMEYYSASRSIFQEASLSLQSWASNDSSIRDRTIFDGVEDTSSLTKVLGLFWNRETDTLLLPVVNFSPFCAPGASKRDVLRGISSLFDPLGFILPLSIPARIFFQDIWKIKLGWDEPLPPNFYDRWIVLATSLSGATPKISRSYLGSSSRVHSLHVFVDASPQAYGAVAYLIDGYQTSFVMSKARVAPLKNERPQLTLPQLELMAAIIGIRVASSVIIAFKERGISITITMWSDSQIVLYWLSKSDRNKNLFVANRISTLQDFNRDHSANWHYCPTTSNPADLVTRGVTLHQLQTSPIWISGPLWLSDRSAWPQWEASGLNSTQVLHLSATHPDPAPASDPTIDISKVMDITRFNWTSLKRTTARVLRQSTNFLQKSPNWIKGPLTTKELLNAEIQWISSFQHHNFAAEIEYLRNMKGRRPPLVTQLDLYIDSDSLIRCKGRILNADIPKAARNPILLPKASEITRLIISYYHERSLHSGVSNTICHIRQRFWIPSIRQQVKSIVRICTRCRRVNGPPYRTPNPATLPSFRVRGDKAFTVTGIDFAGPFPVRDPPGQSDSKAYICLFTYTTSRAIHLELVEDLTAANFILAFRSFISHHFTPTMVISDNATTFECAARALKSLFNSSEVTKYLSDRQIEWRFIPKRAPWYGGFWERLVGLTKEALKKMLGRAKLKFNEFRTIVTEIEAILNDRPLTYVSSDLNDPQALTPSHLLYGDRLTPLPYDPAVEEELLDPTFGEKPSHLLDMFSRRQRILKAFWSRWQRDYLTSLRERHINNKNGFNPSIKVGDVVLVHNEGPRIHWKLAVIDSLITSPDGEIRAANIRTAKGKTNRPVSKLYPLEVTTRVDSSPHTQLPPNSDTSLPKRPRRKAAIAAEQRIRDGAQE